MFFKSYSISSLTVGPYCIQAGAKVNVSAGGATPLHIASDNGSLELMNSLLKAGADPNVADEVRHISFPNLLLLV